MSSGNGFRNSLIPSNVRTGDSFDKGRFPWSQVICTPVPHKWYLVRGEILATQNLPNSQTKTKNSIRIKLKNQVPSAELRHRKVAIPNDRANKVSSKRKNEQSKTYKDYVSCDRDNTKQ